MATCGVNFIPIGDKRLPSQVIVKALESVKNEQNIDRAVAKSYESLPKGTSFEAWNKWFNNFKNLLQVLYQLRI